MIRLFSLSRHLDERNDGVVGNASIISIFHSPFFLHPCSSSRLCVICPSPTRSFKSLTYWYHFPRGGCFGRGCSTPSTFSIHILSSILYGGIRRSWCRENLSRICICILNRHFPTWKVKSSVAHCALVYVFLSRHRTIQLTVC